jgi:hypothetical protein
VVRALLLLCFATLITAPSTRAQDTPPLAWDATTALVVAPTSQTSATLRNDTARDLSVTVQVSGNISVDRPAVELKPAELATIHVISTNAETGTATLAAFVKPSEELPLGYVARRDVTIGGVPPAAVEPTAKVRSTWGGGGATKGNVIPVTASDCAKVAVAEAPAGYVLSDDGRRAAVTLSCQQLGTRAALEMTFDSLARTGAKYTGDVQVGAGKVAVTVDRTMTWPIPVGLLLVGLLIALWILGRGPKRVVNALKVRLLRAQEAIGDRDSPGPAVTRFRNAAGGAEWGNLDLFDDAHAMAQEIANDIGAISKTKRFTLTEESAEVKALGARIDVLKAAGDSLATLAEQLSALQTHLPLVEATKLLPKWTPNVREAFLTARTLTVAAVPAQLNGATEAAAIASWWPSVSQQLELMRNRLAELEHKINQRPPDEQQRINAARGRFSAAQAAFARAESSTEVRTAHANQFKDAQRAVDELASLEVIAGASVAGPVAELLIALDVPAPPELAKQVEQLLTQERRASWIAVVVTAAFILFAGLQVLYIGKTFGTWWDLMAAFAWGAAAGVVLKPLANAIEGLAPIREPQRADG